MKQVTKDQHFVPRFYLKQFAREGKIQVFDVRTKRIGKPRPYASVCYKKFFYAAKTGVQDEISQKLEDLFGKIENTVAGALPGVIGRAVGQQLTNDDLDVLANFMSVQWIRTPHFRELVQEGVGNGLKQIVKKLANLGGLRSTDEGLGMSGEQIEGMEQFIRSGQYNIRILDNRFSLFFVKEIPVFSNLLLAKKWRIVLSEGPYHFITSDNPIAEWWVPPNTSFMERKHYLALTTSILIEVEHPDEMNPKQSPVDRLSYHTANGDEVLRYNMRLACQAHQFAYASQTGEFERLLREGTRVGGEGKAKPLLW